MTLSQSHLRAFVFPGFRARGLTQFHHESPLLTEKSVAECGRLRRACLRQVSFIPISRSPLQHWQEQAPAVQNNLSLAPAGEVLMALELHFLQPQELCKRRLKSAAGVAAWPSGRLLGFYSLSSQCETGRKQYYEKLEACQRAGLDITLWLRCFWNASAGRRKEQRHC
jgi:hypothetical protein